MKKVDTYVRQLIWNYWYNSHTELQRIITKPVIFK